MADDLSTEQIATITAYVDVDAPPPNEPCAVFMFGTNQATPADIAAHRYHRGLAPLIIVTGGVNRHTGIVEGQMFRQWLVDRAVPEAAIRHEDRSVSTWQNVEFALPYLREAVAAGLPITAVCKWYHRRAIHTLRTLLPEADGLYALTWEPFYAGTLVTRTNWFDNPDGRPRVIRESQEVPRRRRQFHRRHAHQRHMALRHASPSALAVTRSTAPQPLPDVIECARTVTFQRPLG